jgi:hypothetical protein
MDSHLRLFETQGEVEMGRGEPGNVGLVCLDDHLSTSIHVCVGVGYVC